MKKYDTNELIEGMDFLDSPDVDMTSSEYVCIKNRCIKSLGQIDIAEMMYESYKLGFAKALISNGLELPKKENRED